MARIADDVALLTAIAIEERYSLLKAPRTTVCAGPEGETTHCIFGIQQAAVCKVVDSCAGASPLSVSSGRELSSEVYIAMRLWQLSGWRFFA
jgi:hypothetical protein